MNYKAATYLVTEKFIPGRFIVPEWTWPGRGTFCLIPGLSRAIWDTWSLYSQLFAGFLSGRVCQRVFGLEGFVRGGFCPFLLLSQYICYNKKLNITLNFMFNMYNK